MGRSVLRPYCARISRASGVGERPQVLRGEPELQGRGARGGGKRVHFEYKGKGVAKAPATVPDQIGAGPRPLHLLARSRTLLKCCWFGGRVLDDRIRDDAQTEDR